MKHLLFKPTEFFKSLKKKPSLNQAMGYLFIGATIGAVFGVIMDIVYNILFARFIPEMEAYTVASSISTFFLFLLSPLVGVVIFGLLMRLSAGLFSIKVKYSDLVALDAYATAPTLVYGWFPIIGWLGSIVHYIFLIVIGGKELFKLSPGKSFFALFFVPILIWLVAFGLFALFIFLILVTIGMMGGFA